MSVRTKRRLMHGLSAGFLAATAGAVSFGLQSPEADRPGDRVARVPSDEKRTDELPGEIETLLAATDTPLQRPLYDPPKPKPAPIIVRPTPKPRPAPTPVVPKVELQLLGTIVEQDTSIAIVADATGAIDQKRIGDTLELQPPGIVVEGIQSGEVVVSHNGKKLTFRIAEVSSPSAKASGKARNKNKQRRKDR